MADVSKSRVMIVDDHVIVLDGLRMLLEMDGAEVVGAAMSGSQAIAKARELKPDVVIMDFEMKDMDGIEAASRIRAELPSTKVIILSVHGEAEDLERAYRAGVERWVSKNASPQSLLEAVSSAGDRVAAPGIDPAEGRCTECSSGM